ncbi:ankyrin repeat-containing domain protein [Amanita rubescens]|nr:ankyrin repeat-containing domain protein [Amanita rubescens]
MPLFDHARNFIISDSVFNNIQGDSAIIERLKEILEDGERQKVMAWVSPIDVSAKHFDVAKAREPGTGEWLLNSNVFQEWERGTGQTLWCPGIPGAGKTVLTSLIIDRLCTLQLREPVGTIAVAWVYLNYKENATQTPDAIHLSLIQQLAGFSTQLYALLGSSYKKHPTSCPPPRRLIPDMRILTREFAKVFIVIDALDECAENNRDTFLDIVADLQTSGANVLITSRDHVCDSITHSKLVGVQRVDIRGSKDDITKFLNARLTNQRRLARIIKNHPSLRKEIVTAIVDSCQGMFLMATFHIEALGKKHNAGEVLETLRVLPKTFPDIYDDAMNRIESDNENSELALKVLSFLVYARRQLTLRELQHFLAVRPGDTDFRDEYVTDGDVLLSVCAGLVVIDDETGVVRLVHFTAQEYFDNIRTSKFPVGDQEMGHACLIYLSFNTFRMLSQSLLDSLGRYALLEYIIQYWHLHISDHQDALRTPLTAFFKDGALLSAYSYFMWLSTYAPSTLRSYHGDPYFNHRRHYRHPYTGLHAAAAAGLQRVAAWLIADNAGANSQDQINSQDHMGRTPLMDASLGGHEKVVDLLITNGADINVQDADKWGDMALQAASRHGHEAVVKLLLENGADINAGDRWLETALQAASEEGHKAVVELLLKNGADINARTIGRYDTALGRASARGHKAVVELLLENGADINAEVSEFGSALGCASYSGWEAVVKLLLENGADVNAEDEWGHSALKEASSQGNEAVVKLLLENGANIQSGRSGHHLPLVGASRGGHEAVVKLLLENGADINAHGEGDRDENALMAASERGHEAVVKLLLENGADINAESKFSGTALMSASRDGHEAVVKLLLEHGADVNVQGEYYCTALTLASEGDHEAVVKLLLQNGADINADGGLALGGASGSGYEAVVKVLLMNGADVNAHGEWHGTALAAASEGGHKAVVKLLLEHGADVNAQGRDYGTALEATSRGGHEAVVRLLPEKFDENGADINV